MNKVGATLVVGFVATFCAGLFAGMKYEGRARAAPEITYLERLVNQYDLRPDQVEAIRGHLEQERQAIDAALERVETQVREQVRAARQAAMVSIRASLDDEQRERFDRDSAGD